MLFSLDQPMTKNQILDSQFLSLSQFEKKRDMTAFFSFLDVHDNKTLWLTFGV